MTNGGKREERESKGPVRCVEGVFIRPNGEIFFDLLNGGHARIPQISHALILLACQADLSIVVRSNFSLDSRLIMHYFLSTIAPCFYTIKTV
jgi:hypothetical protein